MTIQWKNVKPSVLRLHRELRRELEGWIQSLRTELEPAIQGLLGEDWKEVAEKYLYKLEEEERKMCHNATKERGEKERDLESEDKKEEERKPEDNAKEEEERDQEDEAREKEEGHIDMREEKRRIKQTKTRQEEDEAKGMT